MKPFSRTLLPLACVALFGSAHAQTTPNVQTSPWSLAVGAVHLGFNTKADLYAGGPVPGAGVDASSDTIAGLEIAYSFNPNWTARLDLGTPVKTNLSGTGNLGALGRLGGVKGGPAILTLTYSPGMWGPIRPFFGGGMTYLKVFSTSNGALQNLKVDDNFGGAFIVGADWPLADGYSLTFTLQKLYLKTTASGTMGGQPVTANVRLDPLVSFLAVRKQF
ncbi:OmpW family protein [Comamonas thiooxydans]|uniref:Putative outer membrane protein n=1 Tax=Comamonas testosteroni TaxID=285 RepID=I0IJV4_COMTE|nr:OmpW family outer membrane protein [Comamonas thiooxydans]BAJ72251.1 putative outer membrane protein [Acidovorax sp. KKS102]BAM05542.2 putative outer membrane protein [Comamonas testosteroni]BCD52605.1 putative outer membrane protein [Comamonas testosteroni]BCX53363.1 putative outer membrane protein [Comamonas testosteroni]